MFVCSTVVLFVYGTCAVAVPADGKEKSGVKWNGKMTFAASVQSAWPISAINLYDSCLASNISADAKTTAEVSKL